MSMVALAMTVAGCNYHNIIEGNSLGEYYRPADGSSSPFLSKVLEYTPAPGQYIGEPDITPAFILTEIIIQKIQAHSALTVQLPFPVNQKKSQTVLHTFTMLSLL